MEQTLQHKIQISYLKSLCHVCVIVKVPGLKIVMRTFMT